MSSGAANNREFYESRESAVGYLNDPVTLGEERICALLHEVEGAILEVGCGAGRMYEALGIGPARWTGVDYAETPLRLFADRHSGVQLVQADAAALPFKDGSFGAALLGYHMIESILPAARRQQVLAETARVVAPGGMVFLTRHLKWSYHPVGQMLAVLRGQVQELGDLVGAARHGEGEFRMHVLAEREISQAARLAGLERTNSWDYHDGGRVRRCSVSVAEQYVVQRKADL